MENVNYCTNTYCSINNLLKKLEGSGSCDQNAAKQNENKYWTVYDINNSSYYYNYGKLLCAENYSIGNGDDNNDVYLLFRVF